MFITNIYVPLFYLSLGVTRISEFPFTSSRLVEGRKVIETREKTHLNPKPKRKVPKPPINKELPATAPAQAPETMEGTSAGEMIGKDVRRAVHRVSRVPQTSGPLMWSKKFGEEVTIKG